MSKLDKLLGKNKEVNIGGVDLIIKPLPIDHLELFLDLEIDSKRAGALKELITLTLKNSVPDATDAEIKGVAIEHFKKLVEVILDVNGLKNDDKGTVKSA